jgi:hypothetical protein
MSRKTVITLLLILASALALAQHKHKKHDEVPAAFQYAHFIYVEAADGDALKPGLLPEDRRAIYDVEDSVRDWNRYTLVERRQTADIVLVVRKGRIAQVRSAISVGPRLPSGVGSVGNTNPNSNPNSNRGPDQLGQPGDNVGAAAEVGPENDTLRVYLLDADGKLAGPVWMREIQDGLDAPEVLLMRELRTAVEHTYPSQPPAPKQAKP